MTETRFDLIFEGKIEPGYDQIEARHTLESLFEFDTEIQADLYNGQPVALGQSMDVKTANTFKQALAEAGVATYLAATNNSATTEATQSRRSVDRRTNNSRRARVRSTAILPDRRQDRDRRR